MNITRYEPAERDFSLSRDEQVAKITGVAVTEHVFNPTSVYDASKWAVHIYKLADERLAFALSDDRGPLRVHAVPGDADWPHDPYDTRRGMLALAHFAGFDDVE